MDWVWELFDDYGATVLKVMAGLVFLIIVIAILDGGKHRPGEKPPHDSSGG